MILAIDIGNTNIVIGCIKDDKILFTERMSTDSNETVLEYAIGFKKDNTELKDKVEKALKEMAADGTLAKISNEWFGHDVTVIQ